MWLVLGLLLWVGSCVETTDPNTGQKKTHLDPNSKALQAAEGGVELTGAILPLAGPAGALIGGLLLGALGAWRKIKPSLTEAKAEAAQYHAVAAGTVTALEEWKKLAPTQWDQLGTLIKAQMEKQGISPLLVENVIRGLRGLPPKA